MISYQFVFAIIVINLFVAVILAGHEESSRLDEANLSDFYLDEFKDLWADIDHDARGIIPLNQLVLFLAKIDLPFECKSILRGIAKMYLPIITLEEPGKDGGAPTVTRYFLFQDILSAITHLSTEKKIREHELRKMNMKNTLCMEIENARYR